MSGWSWQQPAWLVVTVLVVGATAWFRGRRAAPRLTSAFLGWVAGTGPGSRPTRGGWLWVGKLVGVLALGAALAGPLQWQPVTEESQEGLALALVLDVSSSMARQRADGSTLLGQAQRSLMALVGVQQADQVALVCFAGEPTAGCPPTRDHALVRQWLAQTAAVPPGSAEDRTGIGVALAQAAVLLQGVPARSRQVVLVTDGENNVDRIHPWEGTDLCRDAGIRVHTVAVGDDTADQDLLARIAEATGGVAVAAAEEAGLAQVCARLGDEQLRLAPAPVTQVAVDRAGWLGRGGLLLLLLAYLWERTWGLRLP